MLDISVLPIVSKWDNTNKCMAMKERTPPDCRISVRAWLVDHFVVRWVGCQGPTKWPPRSPDLTSCYFFLWGWATDEVRLSKPKTQDEREQQI
jgi:hypothetical protein